MPSPNPKHAAYTINMDTMVLPSIDKAHQVDALMIHSISSHAFLVDRGTRAAGASGGGRTWKCASASPYAIFTPAKSTSSVLRGNTSARSARGAEARTGRWSAVHIVGARAL